MRPLPFAAAAPAVVPLIRLIRLVLLLGSMFAGLARGAEGPSSRRTNWSITEIMFHPIARADARDLEFVELLNTGGIAEDLAGHRLAGEIEFEFPAGSMVAAGARVVVAKAPADIMAAHDLHGVLGPYSGRLANEGGTVRLLNPAGAVLLEAEYRTTPPWPAGTDGAGLSLVLREATWGERDPRAWSCSSRLGGSPGGEDPAPSEAAFVIEEIRALPLSEDGSYLELRNSTGVTQSLAGLQIVAPAQHYRQTLAPGHALPPGGRVAIPLPSRDGESVAGIGESLLILDATGVECLAASRFGPMANGVALNRDVAAPSGWVAAPTPSPAQPNTARRAPALVFNEMMYHPTDPGERGEFIELLNTSETTWDLSGWRLSDGVDFTFPTGTRMAPGALLVIARDPEFLRSQHPDLGPAILLVGPYAGNLANRGERVVLERPVAESLPIPGGSVAARFYHVVEAEVAYSAGGEWSLWADGGGSSLVRLDPRTSGFAGADWADSDERDAADWTLVEGTGRVELGVGTADQLQVIAMGPGECLVDDVQVMTSGGNNRIAQGTFDTGVSGWIFRGTHAESRWEAGTAALHLIARGRGDTGANRIESPLTQSVAAGSTVTIRARVRWLRGEVHLLFRLRGNGFEVPATLARPTRTGSPGRRNPGEDGTQAPALSEIRHHPVLPRAAQSVVVGVRVSDPDGIASVLLRRRVDPSPVETVQTMNDAGVDGDALAGDGIFSATIPGSAAGTLHAFRIEAVDASSDARRRTFPEAEALIRVGETIPVPGLSTYRLWMTQTTRQRWTSRARLDNTPLPVTFVCNDERVVHGIGALYAGSPHISPGYSGPAGNVCGYVLHFPDHQPFLGATEVVLDWPGRDATAQQEPMAYWIARELGIPFNHRRYIRLHVNGVTETSRGSIYEDAQQVNADLMESWAPDAADGDLYKIEQWFEFDDRLNLTSIVAPRLETYRGANAQLIGRRYRWNWLKRATDAPHDYTDLLQLVDAANQTRGQGYPANLAATVDVEEWMRVFAVENIVVNLDAWGYDIGKNMYAHHAPGSRWRLFMWDIDWVMLASAQHGYTPRSPLMYRGAAPFGDANRDPVVGRMYADPMIQRAYWRAIRDAVDGPLQPDRVRQRLTDTHAALVRAGVTMSSGQSLASPEPVRAWLESRRTFLLEQLATVAALFTVTPPPDSQQSPSELGLTGSAPIEAVSLIVNGTAFPVTWDTVHRWNLRVPLKPGTNLLEIAATDARGLPLPGSPVRHAIRYDGPSTPTLDPVVFNEWMAANASLIQDPADGDFDDWLELFNPRDTTLDLSGWWLTDDPARPDQYVFPPGTLLPARTHLLLWADGEPSQSALGGGLHLPFRLDRSGETLVLRAPGQQTVISMELGTSTTDRARGLSPDGAPGGAVDLAHPTPAAANSAPFRPEDPLRLVAASQIEGGGLALRWNSVPGRRYRLEAATSLAEPARWQAMGQEVTAQGAETSATIPFSPQESATLFLRVSVVP